jgi:hypothetical protein
MPETYGVRHPVLRQDRWKNVLWKRWSENHLHLGAFDEQHVGVATFKI